MCEHMHESEHTGTPVAFSCCLLHSSQKCNIANVTFSDVNILMSFHRKMRHFQQHWPPENELCINLLPSCLCSQFVLYVCTILKLPVKHRGPESRCLNNSAHRSLIHISVISGVLTVLEVCWPQVCVLAAQWYVFNMVVCMFFKLSFMWLPPPAQVIFPVREEKGRHHSNISDWCQL